MQSSKEGIWVILEMNKLVSETLLQNKDTGNLPVSTDFGLSLAPDQHCWQQHWSSFAMQAWIWLQTGWSSEPTVPGERIQRLHLSNCQLWPCHWAADSQAKELSGLVLIFPASPHKPCMRSAVDPTPLSGIEQISDHCKQAPSSLSFTAIFTISHVLAFLRHSSNFTAPGQAEKYQCPISHTWLIKNASLSLCFCFASCI